MSDTLKHEIVTLLAQGFTVKELEVRLKHTESTLDTYIVRLRREYGAKNTTHLIHIFHTKGLL